LAFNSLKIKNTYVDIEINTCAERSRHKMIHVPPEAFYPKLLSSKAGFL
jgi:hypothetical protein